MATTDIPSAPLTARRILHTWWPLAASWLLMALELPAVSAVVARLPNPDINLAAYGGVVSPLSLLIEAPIIMLLAASTALSKDWASYIKIRRFMMRTSAILTAIHALIAFTPLYYVVVGRIIGVPAEIVEPARIGLMIMLPWTWSIAYRRFNQGVLIRFNHSRAVGTGTVVRLTTDLLVLGIGYLIGTLPGIVVGAGAVAAGVVSEAVYAGLRVQPVLKHELRQALPVDPPLSFKAFIAFYVPLVMTSLLSLLVQPIGSAALSRMPHALDSLAVWPVISGLVFLLRSPGVAYNEVVVALLDEPQAVHSLRRFTAAMAIAMTLPLLALAATPLAGLWFGTLSALEPPLTALAQRALWLALPLPALSTLQSWYQGTILHSRRTRGITEAVIIYLATSLIVLGAGILWGRVTGLYVGLAGFAISMLAQTAWLWVRSRPAVLAVEGRKVSALPRLPQEAAGH
jgi:hypothetical protein